MTKKSQEGIEVLVVPKTADIKTYVLAHLNTELRNPLLRYVQFSNLEKILKHGTDRYEQQIFPMNARCAKCVQRKEYEKDKECYAGTVPELESKFENEEDISDTVYKDESDFQDVETDETECPASRMHAKSPNHTQAIQLKEKFANKVCDLSWLFNNAESDGQFILVFDSTKMQPYAHLEISSQFDYAPKKRYTFKD